MYGDNHNQQQGYPNANANDHLYGQPSTQQGLHPQASAGGDCGNYARQCLAKLAPGICCVVFCIIGWYFSPWCSTFGKVCYEGVATATTPPPGFAPAPPLVGAVPAPTPGPIQPASNSAAQAVLNDGANVPVPKMAPAGGAQAVLNDKPAPALAASTQAVLNGGPAAGISSPTPSLGAGAALSPAGVDSTKPAAVASPTPSIQAVPVVPTPAGSDVVAVTTEAPVVPPTPTPAPVVATPAPAPVVATPAPAPAVTPAPPPVVATPAPAPVGPKKIDFYFEIGCPVCETLLEGVMKTVASTYADKVNVEFHPWGNSFYGMASCSSDLAPKPASTVNPDPRYTPTARFCWDKKCTCPGQVGKCVTKDKDCFKGKMVCQHGPKACDLQGYALCAKKAIGDDWKNMLKFSSCLEKGHKKAGEYKFPTGSVGFIAKDCIKKAGLDHATIEKCVKGDEVNQLGKTEAEMTPKHHLVPYVEVDGQPLHGIGATPTMLITAIESARRLTVI